MGSMLNRISLILLLGSVGRLGWAVTKCSTNNTVLYCTRLVWGVHMYSSAVQVHELLNSTQLESDWLRSSCTCTAELYMCTPQTSLVQYSTVLLEEHFVTAQPNLNLTST